MQHVYRIALKNTLHKEPQFGHVKVIRVPAKRIALTRTHLDKLLDASSRQSCAGSRGVDKSRSDMMDGLESSVAKFYRKASS